VTAAYHTSCLCPATLFAGLKGSARAALADIALKGAVLIEVGIVMVDLGDRYFAADLNLVFLVND
jgi:hypothetical protein